MTTDLLDSPVKLVDAASFLSAYYTIFCRQTYRFRTENPAPTILDCGANIGLSVLYFAREYPQSQILAFEPDTAIFGVLQDNAQVNQLSHVILMNKAVWDATGTLSFAPEGADSGRLVEDANESGTYTVATINLRDYLDRPIDLLKLDIEGAETRVLANCQDMLGNVHNLFVEYHSYAGHPQTLHTLLQILHAAGFRLHVHADAPSPQPLYNRAQYAGMDMQLNIFAFREQ